MIRWTAFVSAILIPLFSYIHDYFFPDLDSTILERLVFGGVSLTIGLVTLAKPQGLFYRLLYSFSIFFGLSYFAWLCYTSNLNDFSVNYVLEVFICFCVLLVNIKSPNLVILHAIVSIILFLLFYYYSSAASNFVFEKELNKYSKLFLFVVILISSITYILLQIISDFANEMKGIQVKLEKEVEEKTRKLRKSNNELKSSNEELERFAYIVSHDLKEPLRMVSSYVQLLERKLNKTYELDEASLEFMGHAVSGTKRMQSLLDDLLQYSRVGRENSGYTMVNLHNIVEVIELTYGLALKEKNATLSYQDLPILYYNKSHARILFQNIIGNAIKFNKPNTVNNIRIEAKEFHDYWLFEISDEGIGIDEKYSKQVFTIFQRLHARDTYEGNGVGLALCKRVVNVNKGRIWFESEVGEGTNFFFTINKNSPDVAPQEKDRNSFTDKAPPYGKI